jgi:eukaryotic-like serine/threonine-protein kinase
MSTVLKAGRYEIVGEVGRGAMGVVYKALDPVIGRTVAVKTIRLSEAGTGLSRPELLSRFQTEARAAGLLTHPNIVVVYDAGEEDGLYYITMELVEGKSVQALLDEGQKFSLPRVLRIMDQTCSALQFAHDRHVVHRDIKPANLMLTPDDTVKVTDFGTAKILQMGTVQQTTHVMGTPSYMSPEQVKGRAVDGRSDIFSLGVMLYEMVTGEKPFPGQNITTVIYKIVNEDPIPPRQLDASIHPGISTVIMKALLKEPEERYQSCREMLEDLRAYRAHSALAGNPQTTAALPGPTSPASTLSLGINGRQIGGPHETQITATAQALSSRVTAPGQTPVVRRTAAIAPVAPPERKNNLFVTALITVILAGGIAWGALKLQPVFQAAKEFHEASSGPNPIVKPPSTSPPSAVASAPDPKTSTSGTPTSTTPSPVPAAATNSPSAPGTNQPTDTVAHSTEKLTSQNAEPPAQMSATEKLVSEKTVASHVGTEPSAAKSPDATAPAASGLSPKAEQYKARIDATLAARGLSNRATVQGVDDTLTLSGKLRPREYASLLNFLHNAPPGVKIIDHLEDGQLAGGSGAAAAQRNAVSGAASGRISVVANVRAMASLVAPGGKVEQCQTPCAFNDLPGASYSLEVKKDGYQTVQTALQLDAGQTLEQKISLESLQLGIKIVTDPSGAEVFINGDKQSGQTPVILPLAAGTYNLVLTLPGYGRYAGSVQVKDNVQTQFSTQLHAKDTSRVAWVDISSSPEGAEIVVDGTTTAQLAPARVQLSPGIHRITLKLKGFLPTRQSVDVSEGSSVTVKAALKPLR